MKMNNKLLSLAMLFGLILALAIMIYILVIFKTESAECYLSPLTYGAEKLSEANNAQFTCIGTFNTPGSPIVTITPDNISLQYPNRRDERFDVDWSEIVNITIKE